jgi:hypothetical protein
LIPCCPHPLLFFILLVGVFDTSYLYIAESAFATTIADTDADDVAKPRSMIGYTAIINIRH